jgi:hypothetical protein
MDPSRRNCHSYHIPLPKQDTVAAAWSGRGAGLGPVVETDQAKGVCFGGLQRLVRSENRQVIRRIDFATAFVDRERIRDMVPILPRSSFTNAVVSLMPPEELIQQRVRQIHQDLLAYSRYVREPNFTVIHPRDLEFLFAAYDERFFAGLCQQALNEARIRFRLSARMTKAGGTTKRFTAPTGMVSYEIAIAGSLLFDGFGKMDRRVTVCGLECGNRLEALQRIFEHEIVHLSEELCWGSSDCTAARFQDIAKRVFRHRAHTHDLVTRRERAVASGIRVGSRVTFVFEGSRLTGRVNRITKRATILVEHPTGQQFSDGLRYKTYYVPIALIEPV